MFEIGSSLREARLRQELDFPEIEQATKIRARYLRALEEEHFETLPAQTYVKGFLRTYAEYLGLDGQLYVDEYNSRFITGEEETPLRARSRSLDGKHERRLQSKVVLLVIAAIAVITGLVIAAWKFGSSDSTPAKTQSAPVAKRHVHRHPTPRARTVRLAVRATRGSGSYVEIRVGSSSGHQLYAGTLLSGQGQHFGGKRLWITVSAPANVVLRVNGARRALPGHGYPRILVASAGGTLKVAPRA